MSKLKILESMIRRIVSEEKQKLKKVKIPKLNRDNEEYIIQSAGLDIDSLDELEDDSKSTIQFIKWLKTLPERVIMDSMNSRRYLVELFPSAYIYQKVPYPAFLASILCKTESSEPFTDLGNIYYKRQKVSPEARTVFEKYLYIKPYGGSGYSVEEEFEEGTHEEFLECPEIRKFLKSKYPEIAKQYNI